MGDRIKVVFVDDSPMILRWAARALRRDFDVQTMECPSIAIRAISEGQRHSHSPISDPDVIVSDYEMPYMSGVEFLGKMRETYPRAKLVLFTGRLDVECEFATVIHGKDSQRLMAEIKRRGDDDGTVV